MGKNSGRKLNFTKSQFPPQPKFTKVIFTAIIRFVYLRTEIIGSALDAHSHQTLCHIRVCPGGCFVTDEEQGPRPPSLCGLCLPPARCRCSNRGHLLCGPMDHTSALINSGMGGGQKLQCFSTRCLPAFLHCLLLGEVNKRSPKTQSPRAHSNLPSSKATLRSCPHRDQTVSCLCVCGILSLWQNSFSSPSVRNGLFSSPAYDHTPIGQSVFRSPLGYR